MVIDLQEYYKLFSRALSRILFNGPPGSGKSTGLLTLPAPRHIVIAPNESGHSSILPLKPTGIGNYGTHYKWVKNETTTVYYPEFDPTQPQLVWSQLFAEIMLLMREIAKGANGPVTTLAVDGLHRLYDGIMIAEGWIPDMVDDEKSGRYYVKYHSRFEKFFMPYIHSQIPIIAATVYDGKEPNEADKAHPWIFPRLPGRMAQDVMGMFPLVFHTERRLQIPGVYDYYWRLRPFEKVQGALMHLPIELAQQFPRELQVIYKDGKLGGGWYEFDNYIKKVLSQ